MNTGSNRLITRYIYLIDMYIFFGAIWLKHTIVFDATYATLALFLLQSFTKQELIVSS